MGLAKSSDQPGTGQKIRLSSGRYVTRTIKINGEFVDRDIFDVAFIAAEYVAGELAKVDFIGKSDDFDSEAVLLALKAIEKTINNLWR